MLGKPFWPFLVLTALIHGWLFSFDPMAEFTLRMEGTELKRVQVIIESPEPVEEQPLKKIKIPEQSTPQGSGARQKIAKLSRNKRTVQVKRINLDHPYLKHLIDLLEKFKKYPKLAYRFGQQGKLAIQIELSAKGKMTDYRIIESSGFDRLDQAGLEALRQVYRVWNQSTRPRPVELGKNTLKLDLTLWFKL